MWGKKGTWTWTDFLYFILFYVPMSAIVFLLLFITPDDILDARLYSGGLDDSILVNRMYNRISDTAGDTGRLEHGVVVDLSFLNKNQAKDIFYFHKERPAAFKLSVGQKSAIVNQDFYNISRPLAPIRYNLQDIQKELFMIKDNKIDSLNIELVSTKRKI
jgi:hypothetical protein